MFNVYVNCFQKGNNLLMEFLKYGSNVLLFDLVIFSFKYLSHYLCLSQFLSQKATKVRTLPEIAMEIYKSLCDCS